jgi:hypothetical protein
MTSSVELCLISFINEGGRHCLKMPIDDGSMNGEDLTHFGVQAGDRVPEHAMSRVMS